MQISNGKSLFLRRWGSGSQTSLEYQLLSKVRNRGCGEWLKKLVRLNVPFAALSLGHRMSPLGRGCVKRGKCALGAYS